MTQVPEGWMTVPKVGTWVSSSHPRTILNPCRFFKVVDIHCGSNAEGEPKFSVRGKETCYFALSMITPVSQKEVGVCGFDLTNFGNMEWFKYNLMVGFKLDYLGQDKTYYDSFVFGGPNISMWTSNNPITGEYHQGDRVKNRVPGYAGYIGIQGQASEVRRCANLILDRCKNYKEYDPDCRSFI